MNMQPEHERIDLLVSKIADGEAADSEWSDFNALAERVPTAWRDLARAQHDHAAMSVAVGVALHAVDRVDLPLADAAGRGRAAAAPDVIHFPGKLGMWAGWAAAAAVALAWSGGFRLNPAAQPSASPNTITAGWSADDAINAYKDIGTKSGRYLGEVPERVLVESRPMDQGRGFEVVYVRQFIERAIVTDLMRFGSDDLGNPVPVRINVRPTPGHPE